MVQTCKIIRESDVPHNSRIPLLEIIVRDIKEMRSYFEKPPVEIERSRSPSQRLLQQIKVMDDHDSLEFKSAVKQMRSTISDQFDEKLRARDAELGLLAEKISKACQSLKQREANRIEFIERRLRKLLLNEGIESGQLPD